MREGVCAARRGSTPTGGEHFQSADVVAVRRQRHGHGAPAAALRARRRAGRSGELVGTGRAPPDGASGRDGRRLLRRRPPQLAGPLRRPDPVAAVRGTDPIAGSSAARSGASLPPADLSRSRSDSRGRPVLGAAHHQHMRERFGRGARWVVLCEDLPDLDNRVELSVTLVDGPGSPRPRVTYRLSDDARRATAWSIDRATESLTEAGARTVDGVPMRNNSHLLGTARMGDDRASSVVDRWGMAHDVPNLGIIDGSVFVTVGAVNPTSTICALALRAVDHLLARRGDVPVPEPTRRFAAPAVSAPTPVVVRSQFAPGDRARLRALARGLLPAGERMPAADDAGAADDLLDQVLDARPDLTGDVRRAGCDRVRRSRCTPRRAARHRPARVPRTRPRGARRLLPLARRAGRARLARSGGDAGRALRLPRLPERGIARPPAPTVGTPHE